MSYIHIKVEPNSSRFGAFVKGVDLSLSMSDIVVNKIMEALVCHSVLSFPVQNLNARKLQ
jgi:alpha-ketoglutarate-dependent taurine dioxygenase